jgi:hypothetical protein
MEPILVKGSQPYEADEAIDFLIAEVEGMEAQVDLIADFAARRHTAAIEATRHAWHMLKTIIETSLCFHSFQAQYIRHLSWVMATRKDFSYVPPLQTGQWYQDVSCGLNEARRWRIGDAMTLPANQSPTVRYVRCSTCGDSIREGYFHECRPTIVSDSDYGATWGASTYYTSYYIDGTVTFNIDSTPQSAVIERATLHITNELIDVTSMGDTERRYIPRYGSRPLPEAPRTSGIQGANLTTPGVVYDGSLYTYPLINYNRDVLTREDIERFSGRLTYDPIRMRLDTQPNAQDDMAVLRAQMRYNFSQISPQFFHPADTPPPPGAVSDWSADADPTDSDSVWPPPGISADNI